jgi:hypothetical protein
MKMNERNLLTLQFKFPSTMTATEVESLASKLITQAEGVAVTADNTGTSQCIAERLQAVFSHIKLASFAWATKPYTPDPNYRLGGEFDSQFHPLGNMGQGRRLGSHDNEDMCTPLSAEFCCHSSHSQAKQ